MTMFIDSKIDDKEVRKLIKEISKKAGSAKPAYKIIGDRLKKSVRQNFKDQGRPEEWVGHSEATKKSRKNKSGKILLVRGANGGLFGSINYHASNNEARVGSPKIYAAIQNSGGKAGRGRKVIIPARPYLMIQDEDWTMIINTFTKYLLD